MGTNEKLEALVQVADTAAGLARPLAEQVKARDLRDFRSRVTVGLALKMHAAFIALVRDARVGSDCAMHHLKTMVETFIYLTWVMKEPGDLRARLLYADAVSNSKQYANLNPERTSAQAQDDLKTLLEEATKDIQDQWKQFKKRNGSRISQLSKEALTGIPKWYNGAYRLACGPAHMGDLPYYMPLPNRPLPFEQNETSSLSAFVALDYGLHLLFWLLRTASKELSLDMGQQLEALETRHKGIRG
jgi:hypothetical protein